MLDHAKNWAAVPDWANAVITGPGFTVRSVPVLRQHLVSGNLERFARDHSLDEITGALGIAAGDRYATRMARDRVLAVGLPDLRPGWNDNGYAITRMSSALHVFEIAGERALELIARGSAIDVDNPGPNSATAVAGIVTSLYRHNHPMTLRLHIDRGLAPYMWAWVGAQNLVGSVA